MRLNGLNTIAAAFLLYPPRRRLPNTSTSDACRRQAQRHPLPPAERGDDCRAGVDRRSRRSKARIDSVFPAADSLDRAKCSAMGGLVCHQYVYRRDTLDLKMLTDRITLFTALRFRARIALPGVGGVASCGYEPELMRRAEMRLATNLYWRSDWRLASRATVLAPSILDPCIVTMLRVDATPTMKRMIDGQLARLRQQFDSIIPAVADLKPAADSLWRMRSIRSRSVASTIGLPCRPTVSRTSPAPGRREPALVITAHPWSSGPRRRSIAGRSVARARGQPPAFVPVDVEVPFDDLSGAWRRSCPRDRRGESRSATSTCGAWATRRRQGEREGALSARSFSWGTWGATRALRAIDNLRFTIESTSKMASIAATLGAPTIRGARLATGYGKLSIGNQLDAFRAARRAAEQETAPGVSLSGHYGCAHRRLYDADGVRVAWCLTAPRAST